MSVMNNGSTTTPSSSSGGGGGNVEPDDSGSSSSSSPLRHFRLNCLPPSCYSIHDILHYNPASPDDPTVSIQSQFDSLDCPPSSSGTQPPPPPYNSNNNGLLLLDHHVPSSSSAHLGKRNSLFYFILLKYKIKSTHTQKVVKSQNVVMLNPPLSSLA